MAQGNFQVGDVIIDSCTIEAQNGSIDVTEHIITMSVYEGVFLQSVMGEFVLRESKDLNNSAPFVGGEKIKVAFHTPTMEPAEYEMVINSCQGQVSGENNRNKTYAIKAVGEHALRNSSTYVQKSYNTTIDSMVKDIHEKFLQSSREIKTDSTQGIQKILIDNKRPFDALKMLALRAVSSSHQSSTFVYYEDRDGMRFTTLEQLMQEAQSASRVYEFLPTGRVNYDDFNFNTIIGYVQPQQYNATSKVAGGGLNAQVRQFDFHTLTYKMGNLSFEDGAFKWADSGGGSSVSGDMKSKFGSTPGRMFSLPTTSHPSMPATGIPEMVAKMGGYSTITGQLNLQIKVPGDSSVKVGEGFRADIYSRNESTGVPELERLTSGNYLITAVRHHIDYPRTQPRYTLSIEALKGGYKESA